MRHHSLRALAVRAGGSANGDAQIEQFQRVGGKESGELDSLNKTVLSVFHSVKMPEKSLFKPGLNNGIRRVEQSRPE